MQGSSIRSWRWRRIPAQPFLINQDQALWCIVAIATWKGASFWMIFLWAGLQDIPREIQEAAKIDGANQIQRFLRITLPLIKRPLLFVLVTDTAVNFLLFRSDVSSHERRTVLTRQTS